MSSAQGVGLESAGKDQIHQLTTINLIIIRWQQLVF